MSVYERKMVDEGRSHFNVVSTLILCRTNICDLHLVQVVLVSLWNRQFRQMRRLAYFRTFYHDPLRP